MNPIVRMMKRYIKTPLKYALPLLFIGSLVLVSISGCTSSTSNPTATPSATPSTTHDATLTAIATNMQKTYGADNTTLTWNNDTSVQIYINGTITGFPNAVNHMTFNNDGTTANATADYNFAVSGATSDGGETHFAQAEVTAALGHTPTVIKDLSMHLSGEPVGASEWIQYDNIVVYVND